MGMTRKSVYPVHKLDVFDPHYFKNQCSDNADDSQDVRDFQINQNSFNIVLPDKPKKKAGFMNILKPHEVSQPIFQDECVIRESKIDFLMKLGKFEYINDPTLDKINGLFK